MRSLERRHRRLQHCRQELVSERGAGATPLEQRLHGLLQDPAAVDEDVLEDYTSEEREDAEQTVVDDATAATNLAELDVEIVLLADLVELARRVRAADTDRKWSELRSLLLEDEAMFDTDGRRRKLTVFTEHRDTLSYLVERISDLLGRPEAVVTIHGGVPRRPPGGPGALHPGP